MDNKLDCEIIHDLLPSYADGLTNPKTSQAVREHLSSCAQCSDILRMMREPEPTDNTQSSEIDYLKKVHRRTSRVGMISGITMMIIGMLLIFARVFLIGNQADASDANFQISVSNNIVSVSGTLASSTAGISRIVFEESAGIVNVKIYTAPKTFFNSRTFTKQYTANNTSVGMVRCGDLILWEDGVEISPIAAQLYAAQNPFIGDMSKNSKLAEILGIADQFGSFTNELSTSSTPFGWTLILNNNIVADKESNARDIMAADSYVLLATISNLENVTWEYTSGGDTQTYTVTAQDASGYAGMDIKQCAQSASALQLLIDSLNSKWLGFVSK